MSHLSETFEATVTLDNIQYKGTVTFEDYRIVFFNDKKNYEVPFDWASVKCSVSEESSGSTGLFKRIRAEYHLYDQYNHFFDFIDELYGYNESIEWIQEVLRKYKKIGVDREKETRRQEEIRAEIERQEAENKRIEEERAKQERTRQEEIQLEKARIEKERTEIARMYEELKEEKEKQERIIREYASKKEEEYRRQEEELEREKKVVEEERLALTRLKSEFEKEKEEYKSELDEFRAQRTEVERNDEKRRNQENLRLEKERQEIAKIKGEIEKEREILEIEKSRIEKERVESDQKKDEEYRKQQLLLDSERKELEQIRKGLEDEKARQIAERLSWEEDQIREAQEREEKEAEDKIYSDKQREEIKQLRSELEKLKKELQVNENEDNRLHDVEEDLSITIKESNDLEDSYVEESELDAQLNETASASSGEDGDRLKKILLQEQEIEEKQHDNLGEQKKWGEKKQQLEARCQEELSEHENSVEKTGKQVVEEQKKEKVCITLRKEWSKRERLCDESNKKTHQMAKNDLSGYDKEIIDRWNSFIAKEYHKDTIDADFVVFKVMPDDTKRCLIHNKELIRKQIKYNHKYGHYVFFCPGCMSVYIEEGSVKTIVKDLRQRGIKAVTQPEEIVNNELYLCTDSPKGEDRLSKTSELRQVVTAEIFEKAFKLFVKQADENTKTNIARGLKTPYGVPFRSGIRSCDGADFAQHFGMGAPIKIPYMNWHVVSIYYLTENRKVILGIERKGYDYIDKLNPLKYELIGKKKMNIAVFYESDIEDINYMELYKTFIQISEEVMRIGMY